MKKQAKKKAAPKKQAMKRFPEPREHTLSMSDLFSYWEKIKPWHSEVLAFIYRLDPAKATARWRTEPFPTLLKIPGPEFPASQKDLFTALAAISPSAEWWAEQETIYPCVFCVRLQRSWKTSVGSPRQDEEVCICTFEVER